jgi:hypothetical protein
MAFFKSEISLTFILLIGKLSPLGTNFLLFHFSSTQATLTCGFCLESAPQTRLVSGVKEDK